MGHQFPRYFWYVQSFLGGRKQQPGPWATLTGLGWELGVHLGRCVTLVESSGYSDEFGGSMMWIRLQYISTRHGWWMSIKNVDPTSLIIMYSHEIPWNPTNDFTALQGWLWHILTMGSREKMRLPTVMSRWVRRARRHTKELAQTVVDAGPSKMGVGAEDSMYK